MKVQQHIQGNTIETYRRSVYMYICICICICIYTHAIHCNVIRNETISNRTEDFMFIVIRKSEGGPPPACLLQQYCSVYNLCHSVFISQTSYGKWSHITIHYKYNSWNYRTIRWCLYRRFLIIHDYTIFVWWLFYEHHNKQI